MTSGVGGGWQATTDSTSNSSELCDASSMTWCWGRMPWYPTFALAGGQDMTARRQAAREFATCPKNRHQS